MLKPKKGFVQAQLNIEKLTPIQWDVIMRAMDAYAEHYHEEQVKKLNISDVRYSLDLINLPKDDYKNDIHDQNGKEIPFWQ